MNKHTMDIYSTACVQGQSNYALEHFVDGSQLTPERRFKQAVMELESLHVSRENLEYGLIKLNHKGKKLKAKRTSSPGVDAICLLEAKIGLNTSRTERTERSLLGVTREIAKHEELLEKSAMSLGFDTIDSEEIYQRIQEAEKDYYLIKFATDTAAHMIASKGGPSVGVNLALQQIPEEDLDKFNTLLQGFMYTMSRSSYTKELHKAGAVQALSDKIMQSIALNNETKKKV